MQPQGQGGCLQQGLIEQPALQEVPQAQVQGRIPLQLPVALHLPGVPARRFSAIAPRGAGGEQGLAQFAECGGIEQGIEFKLHRGAPRSAGSLWRSRDGCSGRGSGHNGDTSTGESMARSTIAVFLASTTLIAGLAGCGGEGADEKRDRPAEGASPALTAPEGGDGGEGGEG